MNLYRVSIILVLIILSHSSRLYAVNDTIYLQAGDRITAEVRSLNNNQLRISTSDAGTIRIEWSKIDSVNILNTMRIVLADGRIYYGRILPCGIAKSGKILPYGKEPINVLLMQVVILSPLEETFINRLEGTLGAGMSYTKASNVFQMHYDMNLGYQAQKNQFDLSYSGVFTRERDSETSQNQNGGITFRRYLPRKWFMLSQIIAESNTELQLDLRITAGIGGGNSIILNNSMNLYAAGGILFGRELSEDITQYNVEAKIVADYTVFIYDSPELSLNAHASIIPSLSDPGRFRTEVKSNLKWEVFNNLFLKWSFYHIFDSRPLSGGEEERNDWGINTLGVEFDL